MASRRARRGRASSPSPRCDRVSSSFAPLALVFCSSIPFLVMLLAGRRARMKWIDNFGIQILIYVMLGWG